VWRCGPWEQPLAFLRTRLLADQLKEDAAMGPPPGAIGGEHATIGLALKRLSQQRGSPVGTEHPQDLLQQGAVGFLEGIGQLVNGEVIHGLLL